jgi:hypothetical protein
LYVFVATPREGIAHAGLPKIKTEKNKAKKIVNFFTSDLLGG